MIYEKGIYSQQDINIDQIYFEYIVNSVLHAKSNNLLPSNL